MLFEVSSDDAVKAFQKPSSSYYQKQNSAPMLGFKKKNDSFLPNHSMKFQAFALLESLQDEVDFAAKGLKFGLVVAMHVAIAEAVE